MCLKDDCAHSRYELSTSRQRMAASWQNYLLAREDFLAWAHGQQVHLRDVIHRSQDRLTSQDTWLKSFSADARPAPIAKAIEPQMNAVERR